MIVLLKSLDPCYYIEYYHMYYIESSLATTCNEKQSMNTFWIWEAQSFYVLSVPEFLRFILASFPGPPSQEKGLVHTDCACVTLYPESGYTIILYYHKLFSELSV